MIGEVGPGEMIQLKDEEFQLIADLVYKRTGITLNEKKKALVRGRLHSLARSKGVKTFNGLYEKIVEDCSGTLLHQFIDRISTNHTSFFREMDHFEYLVDSILPQIIQGRKSSSNREIRIWCAGCSSGEEPYTTAMVITNQLALALKEWSVRILATDISLSALHTASKATYLESCIADIPASYRRYFRSDKNESQIVVDCVRKMVLFKRLNLMDEVFPFQGRFDVVFCRNVMIYFDQPTRRRLVGRLHKYMHPGACLFIGHSESLGRQERLFRYVLPTIYRRS